MLRSQHPTLTLKVWSRYHIEIPRAALDSRRDRKRKLSSSFKTMTWTQMTYGFSRDDAGKFLNAYYDTKIFWERPIRKTDQTGVGKLMEMAIKLARAPVPICMCRYSVAEHGGASYFCRIRHKIGLTRVSCSSFAFWRKTGSSSGSDFNAGKIEKS